MAQGPAFQKLPGSDACAGLPSAPEADKLVPQSNRDSRVKREGPETSRGKVIRDNVKYSG